MARPGDVKKRFFLPGMALPMLGGIAAYTLDPSTLSDGPFPAGWVGAGWTISSNKGVCSPTLGSELLTDGGLEGTYSAGLCSALRIYAGTPTLAESADVHGGSKAQSFLADANGENVAFPLLTPEANAWYLFSAWGKRTAGTGGRTGLQVYQGGSTPITNFNSLAHNSASYLQRKVVKRVNTTGNFFVYPAYQSSTSYDTVLLDDCSLKKITQSSMFALRKAKSNVTAKAKYTWDQMGIVGVIARANAISNPNTFLMAYYLLYDATGNTYCVLDKCVSGTWTNLIATWSNSGGAGIGHAPEATQWLEIRCNGTTVQMFQNNIQVGTNQTVTDVNGIYAGVFQSGGSQLESFFVG